MKWKAWEILNRGSNFGPARIFLFKYLNSYACKNIKSFEDIQNSLKVEEITTEVQHCQQKWRLHVVRCQIITPPPKPINRPKGCRDIEIPRGHWMDQLY